MGGKCSLVFAGIHNCQVPANFSDMQPAYGNSSILLVQKSPRFLRPVQSQNSVKIYAACLGTKSVTLPLNLTRLIEGQTYFMG
jgi:hypothetical protein